MKAIIAGSRCGCSMVKLMDGIKVSQFNITEVVSGCAMGIDAQGEIWARDNSIPIKEFPADWEKYGKSAGYIRNSQMADYADCLIAFWDGRSRGTKHMIDIASKKEMPVHIIMI